MSKFLSNLFGGKKAPRVFTVDDEIRIVLIGKTGVGKSETGNSILGKEEFEAQDYATSVTKVCGVAEAIRGDKKIVLVDTPGLFDTKVVLDETKEEVAKCVAISAPGVHCFLLILQIGRFSPEEKETIKELRRLFGEQADRYLIVLFTKIDMLKGSTSDEDKFRNYLANIPGELKEFLQECDMRCIGLNNRADGKKKKNQVERLFKMIEETLSKNGGTCYTNDMYKDAERKIKEAIDKAREEEERRAREEEKTLRLQIEQEKQKEHKKKLEEEMIKLQKQHEEEKQRQEEELRRQIRDQIQQSDKSIMEKIVDGVKHFFGY